MKITKKVQNWISSTGTLQSDQQSVKETVFRDLDELKEVDKATYVGDEPLIFLNPNSSGQGQS